MYRNFKENFYKNKSPGSRHPDHQRNMQGREKTACDMYSHKMEKKLGQHKYFHPKKLQEIHKEVQSYVIEQMINSKAIHQNEASDITVALEKLFIQLEVKHNMSANWASSHCDRVEPVIGIDLGTTNCCVAVYWDNKVKVFQNDMGDRTTPSYVSFQKDGTVVVGKIAKKNSYKNPENTIYDSKRMIGRDYKDPNLIECQKAWPFLVTNDRGKPVINAQGRKFRPEEISKILLQECRMLASKQLQRDIRKAVITVPAYFNDSQRVATIEAAGLAGLEVLEILNEPSAASLAYKIERLYTSSRKVLVFDLGGGTFDVAVLDIGGKISTLAIDGHTCLGGEDFDKELRQYCIQQFKNQFGFDITDKNENPEVSRSLALLTAECEEAKKVLGKNNETDISVRSLAKGYDLDVKITRQTFEYLCDGHFKNMLRLVGNVLREAKVDKSSIEDIILVGGSTRIPKLQDMLQEFFNGKELNHNVNPDEAVAFGAAIQAAIANGQNANDIFHINGIEDVIPMSIGVEAIVGNVAGQFTTIIHKNAKYPTTNSEIYYTSQDYQTRMAIKVFQGNDQIAENNFFLGEFDLDGIPSAKKGEQSIRVSMEINKLGILDVTAMSVGSGGVSSLQVSLKK